MSFLHGISNTTISLLPLEFQAQIPFYDQSVQPKLYIALTFIITIACVSVLLRLQARRITTQPIQWDDYLICLAAGFVTCQSVIMLYLTTQGFGRHAVVMVLENPTCFAVSDKLMMASETLYIPGMICLKLSILLFYLRLFPHASLRKACYFAMGFACVFGVFTILFFLIGPPCPTGTTTSFNTCPPGSDNPGPCVSGTILDGCADRNRVISTSLCAINTVTDAVILGMPLPVVWALQANLQRKMQLTVIFTLGTLVFAISIMRIVSVRNLTVWDSNWGGADMLLWSAAEISAGIVTASLPILQPVLGCVRGRRASRDDRDGVEAERPGADDGDGNILLTFGRSGMKRPSGRRIDSGFLERGSLLSTTSLSRGVSS